MHLIAPGDSLWSIAASELGDGERWSELYAYNRVVIGELSSDGGLPGAAVGRTIVIPETGTGATP
jgi:hypothetical protein